MNTTVTLAQLVRSSAHQVSHFPPSAEWDVHRARDHGVSPYLRALRMCDPTSTIKTFGDFEKMGFDRTQLEIMADMYRLVLLFYLFFTL